ncbi:MAG TPA: TRAP transporter small permease [Burkholderiales bacterium]|jgi:TRAP-type C4-dicarboxylate transport system permease small subunit|nr:TRAP transporter small permease [Burkholderiales bacterium]
MDNRESLLVRSIAMPGMAVAGVAVLAMMFIGAADIVGVLFSYPIPGALEMTQTLMVVVIFLALPQIEARREHITVDMVVQRVQPAVQRVFRAISDMLALVYFSAMTWQGWILFWNSWQMREYAAGSISFPIYPSKALFAVGVTLVCIVVVVNLFRSTSPGRNQEGGIHDV